MEVEKHPNIHIEDVGFVLLGSNWTSKLTSNMSSEGESSSIEILRSKRLLTNERRQRKIFKKLEMMDTVHEMVLKQRREKKKERRKV